MSLRARMRDAFRTLMGYPEPVNGVMPDYPAHMLNHPFRLDPVSLDFAKAVRLIGTVRACVMTKAEDLASLPIIVERETASGWEPIERQDGNVVDVLAKGNPRQSGIEVRRDLQANFITHGNAYLVCETFGAKRVQELWVPVSHLTTVIPGPRRMPSAYIFTRGGREEAIPAENVIPWHDYNSEDEPVGMSALASVQLQYETRFDLIRLFQKVVRNGGVGAGYFKVAPGPGGTVQPLSESAKDAIRAGIKRVRKQMDSDMILDMLEFQKMGLTMNELQFIENTNLTDADICRALGVPPWLIGIKEGAKLGDAGANSQSDERIYWMRQRRTAELRDALFTERLGPKFGEKGVRFRTDFSAIIALNQPVLNSAQQVVALTGRPVITVNQALSMLGQPKSDDPAADVLYEKPDPMPFGAPPGAAPAAPATDPAQSDGKNAPPEPAKKQRFIDTPERAERWRAKDKLMKRYEAKFERAFVGLLRERFTELLRKLENNGIRAAHEKRAIDLDSIFAPDESDAERAQRIYESLIAERGAEAAREIGVELEVALQSQSVRQFILARKTYGLDGALNTTLDAVRASLADGVTKGEGLAELVARVNAARDSATQAQALTVARTEAVSAFNFATAEAWKQSGEVDSMEWLSARDSAVRESHAELDGKLSKLGEAFDNGCEYPGDPAGPMD
ncbi:MAG: phage portal protein, partial [Candidatus Eisenbacteria bacterium]